MFVQLVSNGDKIYLYPNLHPIAIIYIISKITYQEAMFHLGAQDYRCSSIRQPGKLFLKKRRASIKKPRGMKPDVEAREPCVIQC